MQGGATSFHGKYLLQLILWWGGSDPYHGVLVWSEHSNSWHSPRDRQSSILSQSFLSCCCPREPAFWLTLSHHTTLRDSFANALLERWYVVRRLHSNTRNELAS